MFDHHRPSKDAGTEPQEPTISPLRASQVFTVLTGGSVVSLPPAMIRMQQKETLKVIQGGIE